MIILLRSPLKDLPAAQQSYDHDDEGDDQENVDQPANVEREISKCPKNDQNDQYQFKHADLLFSLTFAGRFPDAARKPDGLNKGHFFYAFFVPEYFPAVRRA